MAVCWASTPDRTPILIRGFDSRCPLQIKGKVMAKKVYHIPLQQSQHFIKANKAELNSLCTNKKYLEYTKLLGKSYYQLQIEKFMFFFKINKDITHALNTLEYFNGAKFLDEIFVHLNFSQFNLEKNNVINKDFFYGFCYILTQKNTTLFELLMQKLFLHYHTTFNNTSNINIDYKDMALSIVKSKTITLKESFGEDEKGSFFKILLDGEVVIDEKGKLIKTLRKKVYKNLFYYLIDLDDAISLERDKAYNRVQGLKEM